MDVLNTIDSEESMYIYGAGDVAEQVAYCLLRPPYSKNIKAFLVTSVDRSTRKDINGIPVMAVNDLDDAADALIVVAVLEKYRDEVLTTIHAKGYKNTVCLTFEADATAAMRRRTFEMVQRNGVFSSIGYLPDAGADQKGEADFSQFQIYVAKHDKDRELTMKVPRRPWEIDIQVGTALTNARIADVVDDDGDSISSKNPYYCELTALYWIWKHTDSEYVGLSHYRRRFDLSEAEIAYVMDSGVDILATVPLLNIPDVQYMYKKNHLEEDWKRLETVIREVRPEYLDDFMTIAEGNFYFAYNMFVMRRQCLNDYCAWLFSILEQCENPGIERDAYQSRYIGFLAERLFSVFMLHHAKDYRLAYCDKNFYE